VTRHWYCSCWLRWLVVTPLLICWCQLLVIVDYQCWAVIHCGGGGVDPIVTRTADPGPLQWAVMSPGWLQARLIDPLTDPLMKIVLSPVKQLSVLQWSQCWRWPVVVGALRAPVTNYSIGDCSLLTVIIGIDYSDDPVTGKLELTEWWPQWLTRPSHQLTQWPVTVWPARPLMTNPIDDDQLLTIRNEDQWPVMKWQPS